MILYLDTSSLIKLYVEEEGSEEVRALVREAALVATCVVAYAEARATLARLRRQGRLPPSAYDRAKAQLDRDWPKFLTVGALEGVCREAGDLAERHRLRGFDSLHLAASLWLARQGGVTSVRFSSFDDALNRAARKELRKAGS